VECVLSSNDFSELIATHICSEGSCPPCTGNERQKASIRDQSLHRPCPQRQVAAKYGVDAVAFVDEMPGILRELAPPALHLLSGVNTDSGLTTREAHFEGIEAFCLEREALFPVVTEARVVRPEALPALLGWPAPFLCRTTSVSRTPSTAGYVRGGCPCF
jgi:hypothetical protein